MYKIPFLKLNIKTAAFLLLIACACLAGLSASYFRLLDNYEFELLDIRFRLRAQQQTTDRVMMIEIGEDTIERLGRFPFDRSYHALLVKALSESGTRAILFDIFFSEPEEHDGELEDAMRTAGNVYLPYVFDIDAARKEKILYGRGYTAKTLENLRLLTKGEGHINIIPDADGKFRRIPLYVRYGNTFHPYMSFRMTLDYLGISEKDVKVLPGKFLLLGTYTKIPLDDNSNMIINFSGIWGRAYKHYSYVDVLQSYLADVSGQKPLLDLGIFKDKVCIVGLTAAGTVDLHPNPLEPLYPGVGIHAEVFNSILNRRFITRVSRELNLAVLLVLSLLISLSTLKTKPIKGLSILAAAIILFAVIGMVTFNSSGIWIDLFVPVAVMVLLYLFLTLYKYVTEWRKRLVLENELEIAKKIQESFLPKRLPSTEGIDMAVAMFTARQVGGDLYDFVEFSPDRLGVMIGDVSGKGIPASLFMAMVTREFKFFSTPQAGPQEVLHNLNSLLVKESSSNLFVTVFYLIFDMKAMSVTYSNGGHLPVLYLSEDGAKAEFLDVAEGTPLGLMEGQYGEMTTNFKKGDTFVLYTDGITEAMNPNHEMYGRERLASVVESHRGISSKALLQAIEKDVRRFEPKARQHDDMTSIVIKTL
ncbi:MAG: CHASE2 domain-containing protein [Candidatus Omnitrophica bacterium]|nr:CHASE2 domain-containing protein [Candidatus Omnitrophota bacterium]